jgi:glycosyltransferase involved in cell wall biosynthesis
VNQPLVTVVTATWHRTHKLAERAIPSVNSQTYQNTEHLVVIDGDDADTRLVLEQFGYQADVPSLRRFTFLGRNWTSHADNESIGAVARLVGAWMASGDLVTFLDDDNLYDPTHVEEMVALFDDPSVDFATSRFSVYGGMTLGGAVPPGVGSVDTSSIMFRSKTLQKAGGPKPDGPTDDGNMCDRWVAEGLKYAFKETCTVHLPAYHHGALEY